MSRKYLLMLLLYISCSMHAITQVDFYYYNGNKIPLTLNESKVCISIPNECYETSERIRANVQVLATINDIGNPFAVYGECNTFKKNISVVSCMKDKTIIFDEEWMVLPINNIESICHNTSTQTIKTFDFQGRRITDTPQRGMYIRDGKKYVVK